MSGKTAVAVQKTSGRVPRSRSALKLKPDAEPQVRRTSMSDEAYRVIKGNILTNRYSGGFQILEDELTRSLEMSRTPIREALLRLESEDLIELIPRHGMRVKPLSLEDIKEAYQLLGFMETAAAEMIATRGPNHEAIDALQVHVDDMEACLARDDILGWAEADEKFHRELVNRSRNRRLAKIANTLLDQTERFRRFTMHLRKKPSHFVSSHAELIQEIRNGNVKRIRDVHLAHKGRWLDEMAELVQRLNIHQV